MSVQSKPNQNQRILAYMAENVWITQIEAQNECGVMRLASRISDLRKKGYAIVSERVTVKNRWGERCPIKRYRLRGEEDERTI